MNIKSVPKSILSVIIVFWSVSLTAQTHTLPTPQMSTEGTGGQPPPPGLVVPIDMGIPGLIVGGLIIGFYYRDRL